MRLPSNCKKWCTLLDLCVSSLRRGHANLLCIVPILTDDPRRESRVPRLRVRFWGKRNGSDSAGGKGQATQNCVGKWVVGSLRYLQAQPPAPGRRGASVGAAASGRKRRGDNVGTQASGRQGRGDNVGAQASGRKRFSKKLSRGSLGRCVVGSCQSSRDVAHCTISRAILALDCSRLQ